MGTRKDGAISSKGCILSVVGKGRRGKGGVTCLVDGHDGVWVHSHVEGGKAPDCIDNPAGCIPRVEGDLHRLLLLLLLLLVCGTGGGQGVGGCHPDQAVATEDDGHS